MSRLVLPDPRPKRSRLCYTLAQYFYVSTTFYLKDVELTPLLLLTNSQNMQGFEQTIDKKASARITALELKQLLITLSTTRNVCFRFRQIGEMWMKNHMKVDNIRDNSVLLYDDVDNRYYIVKINTIMQFDIDARFQSLQPNFHYDVSPSAELDS
jgi:hypothetical protein